MLKGVDGRTDGVACLYYKLNYEPKGSGELKMQAISKPIFGEKKLNFCLLNCPENSYAHKGSRD